MTIPKYDEMYRAFLDCLTDGQPHKSKEVKDTIAEVFHISDEERAVLLPSGSGPVFDGRVGWTRTYLKKAGLIQSPSRGVFVLTPAGKQVLSENPNAKTAAGDGIFSRPWLQMFSARIIPLKRRWYFHSLLQGDFFYCFVIFRRSGQIWHRLRAFPPGEALWL